MSGRGNGPVRWLFADQRTGRLVVGQTPNALALCVVAAYAARFAVPRGVKGNSTLRGLGTAALSLWALDELLRGVNPFRRIGGAAVLARLASAESRQV